MLKNQWQDTPLIIASIKDRNPVEEEDEIVLLAAPDPQSMSVSWVDSNVPGSNSDCPAVQVLTRAGGSPKCMTRTSTSSCSTHG